MSWTIRGSVGSWQRGARNDEADVRTIQTLLAAAAQAHGMPAFDPGVVDGVIERPPAVSPTVAAIEAFQRLFMMNPDGVVSVGARTFERLIEAARIAAAPAPVPELAGNFPFRKLPAEPWTTAQRRFAANRDEGRRAHAGCDFYFTAGTPVFAMADGVVLRTPYHFYDIVFAVDIDHGHFIARYGEIRPDCPLRAGDLVTAGTPIAHVGKMKSIPQPMLHLELFDKTATGPLTEQNAARSKKRKADGVPFFRRMDLMDPTPLLAAWSTRLPV
jgi:murein DD-endopeptidase MepM/ murein hydrolase activator NlpD